MSRLQSRRAFVLQFRSSTNIEAGRVDGRLEQVVSGRIAQFHSVDELLEIIKGALQSEDAERTDED